MGLSGAFKRLFRKDTAGGEQKTTFTLSKKFEHQRVTRDGVEVTDPAELDTLVAKLQALNETASASSTTQHLGPVTVTKSETKTNRLINGPEDLGDPAVRAALASVVEELRGKGLGEAASGLAEMLARAEAGQQPAAAPVVPEARPPGAAPQSSAAAPSAPTPPSPPDHA